MQDIRTHAHLAHATDKQMHKIATQIKAQDGPILIGQKTSKHSLTVCINSSPGFKISAFGNVPIIAPQPTGNLHYTDSDSKAASLIVHGWKGPRKLCIFGRDETITFKHTRNGEGNAQNTWRQKHVVLHPY